METVKMTSNRRQTDMDEMKRIFKEALRYYNEGKFEQAESGFNKLISLLGEPSSAELWNKKGLEFHVKINNRIVILREVLQCV